MLLYSAALVGVLGATGACELTSRHTGSFVYHLAFLDTLVRAIGKRAHVFHSITFFSSQCVLGSTTGYAPCFLPERQSQAGSIQHDIIQDPSSDTQASFVACCAAPHRYT